MKMLDGYHHSKQFTVEGNVVNLGFIQLGKKRVSVAANPGLAANPDLAANPYLAANPDLAANPGLAASAGSLHPHGWQKCQSPRRSPPPAAGWSRTAVVERDLLAASKVVAISVIHTSGRIQLCRTEQGSAAK